MSYASMIMGISLALSSTCLPHRIQYSIGGITDTPHAVGLAAIYPEWMNHVLNYSENKFFIGFDSLTSESHKSNHIEKSYLFVEKVNNLMKNIDMNYSLNDLGLLPSQINDMMDKISGNFDNDPSYRSQNDIKKILKNSFI